jgi:hypothetical protein
MAIRSGTVLALAFEGRVVYDTASDPTSHNLWPFEIILAAGPGLAAAFIGAFAAGLFARSSGA